MKKKVVTDNADIEVIVIEGTILMAFTDTVYEDNTVGSYLNAEQAANLADTLIDAIEMCYPEYLETDDIEEEDEKDE